MRPEPRLGGGSAVRTGPTLPVTPVGVPSPRPRGFSSSSWPCWPCRSLSGILRSCGAAVLFRSCPSHGRARPPLYSGRPPRTNLPAVHPTACGSTVASLRVNRVAAPLSRPGRPALASSPVRRPMIGRAATCPAGPGGPGGSAQPSLFPAASDPEMSRVCPLTGGRARAAAIGADAPETPAVRLSRRSSAVPPVPSPPHPVTPPAPVDPRPRRPSSGHPVDARLH